MDQGTASNALRILNADSERVTTDVGVNRHRVEQRTVCMASSHHFGNLRPSVDTISIVKVIFQRQVYRVPTTSTASLSLVSSIGSLSTPYQYRNR